MINNMILIVTFNINIFATERYVEIQEKEYSGNFLATQECQHSLRDFVICRYKNKSAEVMWNIL